ncbi:MAG TPA: folate-binding Fe/S cluster repair protein, partial [Psychrobacter sp.]|nr:folate-binding Fe/S cluster repair protein [Psychrobacter sp.]
VNAMENDNGFIALVVARPEQLAESDLNILDLPAALQVDVARPK